MTTTLITECPDTWLARRLEAGLPPETLKGTPKIDGCTFNGYEARDIGGVSTATAHKLAHRVLSERKSAAA